MTRPLDALVTRPLDALAEAMFLAYQEANRKAVEVYGEKFGEVYSWEVLCRDFPDADASWWRESARVCLRIIGEGKVVTKDAIAELVKRALTAACPHGKGKKPPCRMCLVLRLHRGILYAFRE